MPNAAYYAKNKARLAEYFRRWSGINRDKRANYMRKWRAENRDHVWECNRQYKAKNRKQLLEYSRNYSKKNRNARTKYTQQWRAKNPEKYRLQVKKWSPKALQWAKQNPVMARLKNHRRRERVKATIDKSAINVLSQLISSATKLKCGICGKNMPKSDRTIDHVIPLSKGGTGDVWNLRIVHLVCNVRKNATMPDELNFAGEAVRNCNKISEDGEKARRTQNRHSQEPQ